MQIDEEAGAVAAELREALLHALGDDLLGLILYGSAVSGGFDPGISDVDLIAVTARPTAELDIEALRALHRSLVERRPGWHDRVEVVYIGRDALDAFRTTPEQLIVISPGEPLHRTGPASDWLQNWYLARTTGVSIAGAQPADLIPPIAPDEFLAGVRWYLRYLAAYVDDDSSAGGIAYAVLSAARGARTLATGEPASKQAGAAWLRARRPEWVDVIDEALATRLQRSAGGFIDARLRARAVSVVTEIARGAGQRPS